jgi:hypothetical protein
MGFILRFKPLPLASIVVAALAGCGSSSAGICSDVCDCMGCSDKEEEDCVDSLDDAEKAAADEGCEDAYDDYVACFSDELECRDEVVAADGCDAEAEALAECADGSFGGFGVDVCQRAYEICGVDGGGSAEVECSGTTECAARCIVDANSCEATSADSPLTMCINDCVGAAE